MRGFLMQDMPEAVGLARCRARQPVGFRPGRATYFLLLAQKKVGKEKSLNTSGRLVSHEGSVDPDRGSSQAASSRQKSRPNAVRALCFGYFHLGQQMKVTRPAGARPGALPRGAQACRQGAADRAIPKTQQASAGVTP